MSNQDKQELQLLNEIEQQGLLKKLVQQLNKDLNMSGVDRELEIHIPPQKIVESLYEILLDLITDDFKTYLSFLYRVDISESRIRSIKETEASQIAEILTLWVLKREWQKVWFRNRIQ